MGRRLFFGWILGVILYSTSIIFAVTDNYILYDKSQLQTLKTTGQFLPLHQSKASILKRADALLRSPTVSVTQKKVLPPSGNPHDYVSASIYSWPDPNKPGGLPYINRDGHVNPETADGTRYDRVRLHTMTDAVRWLALAYYLSGKDVYAIKAAAFINTWFVHPTTRMTPHLTYGQGKPGITTGSPSGMIETVRLVYIIDAMRLLEGSTALTPQDRDRVTAWFKDYTYWALSSTFGHAQGSARNNIGTWYDAQVAIYAHFTGQDDIALQILENAPLKRIKAQIEPDGQMPREYVRTKSQQYSAYNLKAFITLARLGDQLSVNIWDYQSRDGRSLVKALDYLSHTVSGDRKWPKEDLATLADYDFAIYLYLANTHYQSALYDRAIRTIFAKPRGPKR